jgi:hypothetical protein
MHTNDLDESLPYLFSELLHGDPGAGAFTLNRGDEGLLAGLDRLSAEAASRSLHGGGTVAAHVDHVRYGLSLLNQWAVVGNDNPYRNANWGQAWERSTVNEDEWRQLRAELREEAENWLGVLKSPREISGWEVSGVIGSIVHLGYHLGALRQIAPEMRGPVEGSEGRG